MWKYTNTSFLHKFIAFIVFISFWFISWNLPLDSGPVSECLDYMSSTSTNTNVTSNPCLLVRVPQQILLTLTLPLMFMSRIPQVALSHI